jgi:hypothetical protein
MKNEHILDILDDKAFSDLSKDELKIIEAHASRCNACGQGFAAAKVSSVLLRADAFETFTAPPFFATRVMANLREKQIAANPFAAVERMWKASKTLIGAMTLTVIVLIVLTVFATNLDNAPNTDTGYAFDNYSTEMVILNEKIAAKEPTKEQIFQVVYGVEK